MIIDPNKEKQAIQWLSNEIKQIPNVFRKNEIQESITLNNKKVPPLCEIVLYKYNAVVGNLNGYWDKFPMVLIVRPLEDHFFGFNLHYLDQETRENIIGTMMHIHTQTRGNKKELFKRMYPFLDGLVKIGIYNHAYKNYLYQRLESKFIIINPKYYDLVTALPIARFKGNNTQ